MLDQLRSATIDRFSTVVLEGWQRSSARQWLFSLSPRDRNAVYVLAGFLAVLIVYGGIWQPLAEWRERADERYRNALAIQAWLDRHEDALTAAAQARESGAREGASLLSLVANSAASEGVDLARVQPQAGGVDVVIQEQEFNRLLFWLERLVRQEQLAIRQISIDAQSDPGIVTARVSLM